MGQSEVSEVLAGRRVMAYDVLVRIAEGLGVERGWMGLAYDPAALDIGSPTVEEVTDDMKRRAFLAAASVALWGRPVLGELLELPVRPETPTPLPAQLGVGDVDALRALTEQMRALARFYGGYSDMLAPTAARAERLLSVPAAEPVRRSLGSVLAELHIVSGWAAHDTGLRDTAQHHFTKAMDLAAAVDDHYRVANTLVHAGIAADETGHPDHGVKLYQLAAVKLADAADPGALGGWLHALTASAYARMERSEAREELSAALDGWTAPNGFEHAVMDWRAAVTYADLDDLDRAETHAAGSVRAWQGSNERRDTVLADVTLATVHVRAGERDGLPRAQQAIREVAELRSVRARDRLTPLAEALAARPDSGSRELAQHARRVAAVPA